MRISIQLGDNGADDMVGYFAATMVGYFAATIEEGADKHTVFIRAVLLNDIWNAISLLVEDFRRIAYGIIPEGTIVFSSLDNFP